MKGQHEQQLSQETLLWSGSQWVDKLGHFTVDARPALVTLAGEFVLHAQYIVVVEVSAHMEAWATGSSVEVNVKGAGVQVQVGSRIHALTYTFTILVAQSFAAQLSCRSNIDDVMAK